MMFSLLPVSAAAKWYGEHNVTVKYVFNDDSPNSKPDDVKKTIASTVGAITTFKVEKAGYNHSAKVTSGNAECSIDDLGYLHVTHVDKDSVITVTYTPKGNVITIDQYYNNGTILAQWATNFKVNGLNIVENNKLEKGAIIDNTELTDATEKYRFPTVGGKTYDFSYARQIPSPSESSDTKLAKVWYERDTGEWYYAHLDNAKLPLGNKSGVNFCYNKEHNEASAHHQFDQFVETVAPTCTEQGYTVYKCKYCGMTKQDDFKGSLGHDWGTYVHVDGTEKENSQHYQVCNRCNKNDTIENCRFGLATAETGTHTCTVCEYSYTDEVTPTETPKTPVYVYFRTVDTAGIPIKNDVKDVKHNVNGKGWATLGKLTTTTDVATAKAADIGKEVTDAVENANGKFLKHSDNEDFNLALISNWVGLTQNNGAAGYESEAPFGTYVWHLDGKVTAYRVTYKANPPAGVDEEAVTGMPDPAYYLPNGKATVSTDAPKLQGYDFGGWYTNSKCEGKAIGTVTVTGDTDLYAKWTPAQPTADLVDDAITIYHQVNSEADWHGGNAYADASAHQAGRTPTISYQAELDLSEMKLQKNNQTASIIDAYGEKPWGNLVEAVKAAQGSLAMFSGSEIVLHVQLDKQLSTADIQNQLNLNNIKVTSDWFELSKAGNPVVYDENAQSLTITCVPKIKADGYDSTITLSGLNNLSLTNQAQGELSSGKELNVISKGYIDGTIKITIKIYEPEAYALSPIGYTSHTRELSLIGKSKEDPAKNTAKLKLATYTVTYDANGGSGTTTDPTAYATGEKAKVKENGFNRNGYTFTGWNMQEDGKGKSWKAGDIIDVTGNIVLYAQWSENSSGGGGDDSKTYYYFAVKKVDAQDGHALNGAKFKLYLDGKQVATATSNRSGIALFRIDENDYRKITVGSKLYYQELTAPEGYVVNSDEVSIKKNNLTTSRNKAEKDAKTVWNYRGTTPDLLNGDDHFAYVVGYQDGCVHPDALITRAETATIFFRLLKDSVRDGNLLTSNTYTDVADDYWANTAISTMTGLGIVQGRSTTTFDPKAPITRAQFAAICARFDTGKSSGTQSFTDIKGHWAEMYIQRAAELGWIKGFEDGTFRPDTYITRAQAMTMINRVLNRIPEDASDLLPNMNVWPDCNPGDWFYLAIQEATNSHDFKHKAGNYETWTGMNKDPDWTRYEN